MSAKLAADYPFDEKAQVDNIRAVAPSPDSLEKGSSVFDRARTARLLRKLDWNLIPFLALLYLLSFLDRSNVGNARLAGLEKDLKMKGLDFNIALAVFFPFYVAAEIPSNIMMKRTSPSLWLCILMTAWGICMICMGFVRSFPGLLVARMALGIAEGGLFPGVTWYITLWYKRHECGLRMAIFFSAATLAGAFGGLLARGISEMDGLHGRPGWSWIFIIEGTATVFVAIFAKWVINDSPETARFLSEEEKTEVKARLKQDRSALADEFSTKYLWDAVKDWKIWVHMLITFGIYTPLYSISLFLPTIVKGMGYSNNKSQLMSVPPYVVGCIATISLGYAADKSKKRGIYMIICNILAIIGFIMLISTHRPVVQYIGTFFAVSGIYPNVSQGVAWNGNNIGGATKRAVGIAMHVGFGNLGGILAGFSFRAVDAPRYFSGHGLLIGTITMSTILCIGMHLYLVKENKRRDDAMRAKGLTLEDYTEDMKYLEREKGDNASFFRYTI